MDINKWQENLLRFNPQLREAGWIPPKDLPYVNDKGITIIPNETKD